MSKFDTHIAGRITARPEIGMSASSPKERVGAIACARDLSPNDLRDLETIFLAGTDFSLQRDIVQIFLALRERLIDAEDHLYETPRADIRDTVQRMCAKPSIPHFLKKELEYTLTPPLTRFTVQDKRDLLKDNWDTFSVSGAGDWFGADKSPDVLDAMSETEIDRLFTAYRGSAPELFLFEEFLNLRDRFHSPRMEQCSNLIVDPKSPSHNKNNANFSVDTSLYFLTKASDSFGTLHTLDGKVHSFFPLEPQKSPGAPTRRMLLTQVLRQEGALEDNQSVDPDLEKDYLLLLEPEFRATLEREMGVSLDTLSVRHQLQLLAFLSHKTDSEVTRVYDFINSAHADHKSNRLKSFLSLEEGLSGDSIVAIGEFYPEPIARSIFLHYARLIDTSEETALQMAQSLRNPDVLTPATQKDIARHIRKKAADFLVEISKNLSGNADSQPNPTQVLNTLRNYQSDIILTAGIFSALRGTLDIEDIRDITIERIPCVSYQEYAEDIHRLANEEPAPDQEKSLPDADPLNDVRQFFALIDRNYESRPQMKTLLKRGFAQSLTRRSEHTTLYTIKRGDNVMALARFEDRGNGTKYFGSFNILSSAQRSSIAPAFFERIIAQEAPGYEISATCDAFSPASALYIESGHFSAEEVDTESDPEGVPWFVIRRERDETRHTFYEAKDLPTEYDQQAIPDGQWLKHDHFIMRSSQDTAEMTRVTKELTGTHSYRLTRLYRDKSSGYLYCAFERPASS